MKTTKTILAGLALIGALSMTGCVSSTQDSLEENNTPVEQKQEQPKEDVKEEKKEEEKVEMGQCYDCGEMKPVKEMTFNGRSYHCGCTDLDKAKEPVKDICPLSGKGDIPEHLKRDCAQFHEKEDKCKTCGAVGTDVSNGICADCAEQEQSDNNEALYGTPDNQYYCENCGGWFPTGTLCDCDM